MAAADNARHAPQVSILFADIVGWTEMCKTQPPEVVMALLNDLFTRWARGAGWLVKRGSVQRSRPFF